jgi:hypothetical protein
MTPEWLEHFRRVMQPQIEADRKREQLKQDWARSLCERQQLFINCVERWGLPTGRAVSDSPKGQIPKDGRCIVCDVPLTFYARTSSVQTVQLKFGFVHLGQFKRWSFWTHSRTCAIWLDHAETILNTHYSQVRAELDSVEYEFKTRHKEITCQNKNR